VTTAGGEKAFMHWNRIVAEKRDGTAVNGNSARHPKERNPVASSRKVRDNSERKRVRMEIRRRPIMALAPGTTKGGGGGDPSPLASQNLKDR